jgi:hypothetical protein
MAPMADIPEETRKYLSEIGRKGGKAGRGKKDIRKGFATMPPERLRQIAKQAAEAKRSKQTDTPKSGE